MTSAPIAPLPALARQALPHGKERTRPGAAAEWSCGDHVPRVVCRRRPFGCPLPCEPSSGGDGLSRRCRRLV